MDWSKNTGIFKQSTYSPLHVARLAISDPCTDKCIAEVAGFTQPYIDKVLLLAFLFASQYTHLAITILSGQNSY